MGNASSLASGNGGAIYFARNWRRSQGLSIKLQRAKSWGRGNEIEVKPIARRGVPNVLTHERGLRHETN